MPTAPERRSLCNTCPERLRRRRRARYKPLKPTKAAVELIRRQPLRLDASAVQLQSEWTLDTPIADMAQMVPRWLHIRILPAVQPCNMYMYVRARV